MENDTREFLIRIANTIGITLLWMMINVLVGLYFQFAFFSQHPAWQCGMFYAWFFISLAVLVLYIVRKWKGK